MHFRSVCAGLFVVCVLGLPTGARAQTTVTLDSSSNTADTAIRGGTFAATNFDGDLLVTRASSDPTYVRRTLMNFDTSTTIPAGARIESATLAITVHWGGSDS